MKLTVVTETFPPEINGVAMTFGHLARELGRRGNEVTVCRPRRSDLGTPPVPDGFTEFLVCGVPIPGYPLLRLGLLAGRALRWRWRRERPDLVHVVTEGPLGASAVSAARALGIPVTSSFHTNFHAYTQHYGFSILRTAALGWLRRVHNRTAKTFAPTQELCDELTALDFRNVQILSRGVDTDQFTPPRSAGAFGAMCGHIHTPGDKMIGGMRYLNSGDWVESLTAIVEYWDGCYEVVSFADFARVYPMDSYETESEPIRVDAVDGVLAFSRSPA